MEIQDHEIVGGAGSDKQMLSLMIQMSESVQGSASRYRGRLTR